MKLISLFVIAALSMAMPAFAQSQAVDRDAWMQAEVRAKLRPGMSEKQVNGVLGKPSRFRITRSDAGTTRDLEYRSSDGKDWMIVNLTDGMLMSGYSVARLGLAGESSDTQKWRTPSNWLKVNPGMSLDQVETMLGKPTAEARAGGGMMPETLSGWLYEIDPETNLATGLIFLDSAGLVISVWTPLFPPSE